MILSYAQETIEAAERLAQSGNFEEVYRELQHLTLADFCELIADVPPKYPELQNILPRMPSEAIQKRWVGDSGARLIGRSCAVVRLFDGLSWRISGRSLRGRTVLDYGCGWGRLLRLMYYAAGPTTVYGVDPTQESLDICRDCGITERITLCDRIPEHLPFPGIQFDFIFSFSVFTHLPEWLAGHVLGVARRRIADGGIYVITVRPMEFWAAAQPAGGKAGLQALQEAHEREGHAFLPIPPTEDHAAATWGDTTYSLARLQRLVSAAGWQIAAIDRDLSESFQIAVALVRGARII